MKIKNKLLILLFSLFLMACSNNSYIKKKEYEKPVVTEELSILYGENDPLGPLNRRLYYFNGMADRYVLKPTITNYEYYTPSFFQRGVHNFFTNFSNISTAINSFLQLQFKDGIQTVLRFGINSTVGILGIFDPATTLKIPQYKKNFGMTLAYYGVKRGPYVVAPLIGPSNVRDLSAMGANAYFVHSLDVYHPVHIDFSNLEVAAPRAFSIKVDAGIFFLESDHVFEYEYMRLLAEKYVTFKEKQNKNQ